MPGMDLKFINVQIKIKYVQLKIIIMHLII